MDAGDASGTFSEGVMGEGFGEGSRDATASLTDSFTRRIISSSSRSIGSLTMLCSRFSSFSSGLVSILSFIVSSVLVSTISSNLVSTFSFIFFSTTLSTFALSSTTLVSIDLL